MTAHPYRTSKAWRQPSEDGDVDTLRMPIMFARVGLGMWSLARVVTALVAGWDFEGVLGVGALIVLFGPMLWSVAHRIRQRSIG